MARDRKAEPISSETLTREQGTQRLRQYGAKAWPMQNDNIVYWAESRNVWIKVSGAAGGNYLFEYYRGCPC